MAVAAAYAATGVLEAVDIGSAPPESDLRGRSISVEPTPRVGAMFPPLDLSKPPEDRGQPVELDTRFHKRRPSGRFW